MTAWTENDQKQYHALTAAAGLVAPTDRTQIEVTGSDRAELLHNFCTNDVRRLTPGQGCEAFVTDVRSRILGHVHLFCGHDSLVLDTVAGQAEALIAHFNRYVFREQVELHDRSRQWAALLLAGAHAAELLARWSGSPPPSETCSHATVAMDGRQVSLRRVEIAVPCAYLLSVARDDLAHVAAALIQAGAVACEPAALEAARLEAGFPWFGRDVTDKNLPHEVGRNNRAVCFTKGCYLGQEPIARIESLGHANRQLVGVRWPSANPPAAETPLSVDGVEVGRVTSAAFSPRLNTALALAYVRRGHEQPATPLQTADGQAEVVELPLDR